MGTGQGRSMAGAGHGRAGTKLCRGRTVTGGQGQRRTNQLNTAGQTEVTPLSLNGKKFGR